MGDIRRNCISRMNFSLAKSLLDTFSVFIIFQQNKNFPQAKGKKYNLTVYDHNFRYLCR